MKKAYLCVMVMILSIFIIPACNTSRATKGAVIGAAAGGAAGAVLSKIDIVGSRIVFWPYIRLPLF